MKTMKYFMGALLCCAVVFSACKKDDKINPNVTPEEPTPELDEPEAGYVRFIIQIPKGTECNGIAFKGTFDGAAWSGKDTYCDAELNAQAAPDACVKFAAIPDFEGWFTADYKMPETSWEATDSAGNAVQNYMAGKICLIYAGDNSWEGQFADWKYISNTADVSVSKDGNMQINSNTGSVSVKVGGWQNSECEAPVPAGKGKFYVTLTNYVPVEGDQVIFAGNFAENSWGDSDRVMTLEAGKYVWEGEYPQNFQYKVFVKNGDTQTWAAGDNAKFDGTNFEHEFELDL